MKYLKYFLYIFISNFIIIYDNLFKFNLDILLINNSYKIIYYYSLKIFIIIN